MIISRKSIWSSVILGGAALMAALVALTDGGKNADWRDGPGQPSSKRSEGAVIQVGKIQSKAIQESSGLVASRRHPGVFWTHNDSGHEASLFAITLEGRLLREYRVAAKPGDWEDIAADDHGNLFLGKIGNNDGRKNWLEVYRVAEPDPAADSSQKKPKLAVDQAWRLKYPAKPFDCESLFILGDSGYVVSKVFKGEPAAIYRFPLPASSEPIVLQWVTQLPVHSPVTAADISPDGKRLAILSQAGLYVFEIGGEVARAGRAQPIQIKLPPRQLEAVCFAREGIVMTAESREIYLYSRNLVR